MGQFLSSELDWVYDPIESRWRLGLDTTPPLRTNSKNNNNNNNNTTSSEEEDESEEDGSKNNNTRRHPTFSFQTSARNDRALSLLYAALVQSFCSASGVGFNEDRSSASTVMKRKFDRPLIFTVNSDTVPMHDVEGGLGAVEPKTAAATFLVARNFGSAFCELEGDEDEAAALTAAARAGGGGGYRARQNIEHSRERAAHRREALMHVENAATTIYTNQDATKFSPFRHYLEVADGGGRCVFARQSETGAVVFDCLEPTGLDEGQVKPHSLYGLSIIKEQMLQSLQAAASAKREAEEIERKEEETKKRKELINRMRRGSLSPEQSGASLSELVIADQEKEQKEQQLQEFEDEEEEDGGEKLKEEKSSFQNNASAAVISDVAISLSENDDDDGDDDETAASSSPKKKKVSLPSAPSSSSVGGMRSESSAVLQNNDDQSVSASKYQLYGGAQSFFGFDQMKAETVADNFAGMSSPGEGNKSSSSSGGGDDGEGNNKEGGERQGGGQRPQQKERTITFLSLSDSSDTKLGDGGGDGGDENEKNTKNSGQTQPKLGVQVTCHSLHHLMAYLALVASAAAAEDVEFSMMGEEGEIIQSTLWEYASQSPGFLLPEQPKEQSSSSSSKSHHHHHHDRHHHHHHSKSKRGGRSSSPPSSPSSSNLSKPNNQQQQQQQKRGGQISFARQPVFALRSLIARCGMSIFPPRGTAEARRLTTSEESDLFFTSVGCQMAVECCSRLIAFHNVFQPLLGVSFERTAEGDLDISRFSSTAPTAASSSFASSSSFSYSPGAGSSSSSSIFGSPASSSASGATAAAAAAAAHQNILLQKIYKSGVKPRLSKSACDTATKAILQGRLVSAIAESEVHGVILIASGATLEVVNSSPRTLQAVSKELTRVLESVAKHCPPSTNPSEFILRELIDTCFYDNLALVDRLVGALHSAKSRSILGTKDHAGSLFRLLHGLTETVPLPEASGAGGGGGEDNNNNNSGSGRKGRRHRRREGVSLGDDGFISDEEDYDDDEEEEAEEEDEEGEAREEEIEVEEEQEVEEEVEGEKKKKVVTVIKKVMVTKKVLKKITRDQNSRKKKQQQQKKRANNNDDNQRFRTVEERLVKSISDSPCRRVRPGQEHLQQQQHQQEQNYRRQLTGATENSTSLMIQQQLNSAQHFHDWKEEGMITTPAEYVNTALKKCVDKTQETSNSILSRIKEVSHVLNSSKKKKRSSASASPSSSSSPTSSGKYGSSRNNNNKRKGSLDNFVRYGSSPYFVEDDIEGENDDDGENEDDGDNEDEQNHHEHEEEQDEETRIQREQDEAERARRVAQKEEQDAVALKALFLASEKSALGSGNDPHNRRGAAAGSRKRKSNIGGGGNSSGNNNEGSGGGVEGTSLPITEETERQLYQWERAINLLQVQSRVITRVSPHPALAAHHQQQNQQQKQSQQEAAERSLSGSFSAGYQQQEGGGGHNSSKKRGTLVDPNSLEQFTAFESGPLSHSSSSLSLSENSSGKNFALLQQQQQQDKSYSQAEVLNFAKTLLFFIAALREVDMDLITHLQQMRLRNRSLHSSPPSLCATPLNAMLTMSTQRHERIYAEFDLLKSFSSVHTYYRGPTNTSGSSSGNLRNSVSSSSQHQQRGASQVGFVPSSLPLPAPCSESLRVTNCEIHFPPVICAFSSPRVRPLAEIHVSIKDRNSPSPRSSFSASSSSSSFSTTSSSSIAQQHFRVCVYANGVLLFPDTSRAAAAVAASSSSSVNASAPSLANALSAVEFASQSRQSQHSSSHESTLLVQSSGAGAGRSSSSSSSSNRASFFSATSQSKSELLAAAAASLSTRLPNRIAADTLLLLGAKHFSSLHELLLNLLPDAYVTWDRLFESTNVNLVLSEKQQELERQQENMRALLRQQHQQGGSGGGGGLAGLYPQGRPTSSLSTTSTASSLPQLAPARTPTPRLDGGRSSASGGASQQQQQQQQQQHLSIGSQHHQNQGSVMVLCDSVPRASILRKVLAREAQEKSQEAAKEQQVQLERERQRAIVEANQQHHHHQYRQSSSSSSSRRMLPQPPPLSSSSPSSSSSRKHHLSQNQPGGDLPSSSASPSEAGETSSNAGASSMNDSSTSRMFVPKPLVLQDYSPSQLHNSSMMSILLAPRLHGEPILRALGPPLFTDPTSALKLHAEFLVKTLLHPTSSHSSSAHSLFSSSSHAASSSSSSSGSLLGPSPSSSLLSASSFRATTGEMSGGGAGSSNNNLLPSTSSRGNFASSSSFSGATSSSPSSSSSSAASSIQSSFSTVTPQTEGNFAWSLGTRWFMCAETNPSPISVMLQSSLLHRPVLRGLSTLVSDFASSTSSGSHHHHHHHHHSKKHAASILTQLVQDTTVWDKISKFMDPPRYGSELPTPARLLYGLALTRDLIHSLDGFLQSLPLEGLSITEQHELLEKNSHVFTILEKNFSHTFTNVVRLACTGSTTHRVFSRAIAALSTYIGVTTAHFSRLALWPAVQSKRNLPAPEVGATATPLHKLLWIGLSFIDVRGLLAAVTARCSACLGVLIDYQATEDQEALVISMTDASTEKLDETHGGGNNNNKNLNNNNNNNRSGASGSNVRTPTTPASPASASSPFPPNRRKSYQQQQPWNRQQQFQLQQAEEEEANQQTHVLTPAEMLTDDALDPEFVESLKISGAHETAALVVTCGVQLIAVSSSASSDIARRWIHGNIFSSASAASQNAAPPGSPTSPTSPAASSSSSSSGAISSATIFLLDQILTSGLPELRIAFHFSTLAWRAFCLLGSPSVSSNPVVPASPYGGDASRGNTVAEWSLSPALLKTIASTVVGQLAIASNILPDPTVPSLLSLVAVLHRISPSPGPLFSNLRLDRPIAALWEFLTTRSQQRNHYFASGRNALKIFDEDGSGGGGDGMSAFSGGGGGNKKSGGGNDLSVSVTATIRLVADDMIKNSATGFGSTSASSSSTASSKHQTKQRKELSALAELATEITESEFFLSLCWATSVAEDSLTVPVNVSPWMIGLLENQPAVGHAIPPVVDKHTLAWSSSNPYSRLMAVPITQQQRQQQQQQNASSTTSSPISVSSPVSALLSNAASGTTPVTTSLPGASSIFHLALMRSFTRWMSEPSSSFVGGYSTRFGAPFALPMWTHIVEKLVPAILAPRWNQLQQHLSGTALGEKTSGENSSSLLISNFEVYAQFCFSLLSLLADARESACEVLLFDAVDQLDSEVDVPSSPLDFMPAFLVGGNSSSSTSGIKIGSPKMLLQHQQQQQQQQKKGEDEKKEQKKPKGVTFAAAAASTTTSSSSSSSSSNKKNYNNSHARSHKLLCPVSDVKDPFSHLIANSTLVFDQVHSLLMLAITQTATATFGTSKLFAQTSEGPVPLLLSQAFRDVVNIASNFQALVPALDVLLLPHALKQMTLLPINSIRPSSAPPPPLPPSFENNDPSSAPSSSSSSPNDIFSPPSEEQVKNTEKAFNPKFVETKELVTLPNNNSSLLLPSPTATAGGINTATGGGTGRPEEEINLAHWGVKRLQHLGETASAIFPEVLYVPQNRAKAAATLSGSLEAITALRTLARSVQTASLHFAHDLKKKTMVDAHFQTFVETQQNNNNNQQQQASRHQHHHHRNQQQQQQQQQQQPTTQSQQMQQELQRLLWPIPDWTRSLPVLMTLLELVSSSPSSLGVIRGQRTAAHLIFEVELSLLSLASHAAMSINAFSQIVPALSFFLVRFAQSKNLMQNDADTLKSGFYNSASANNNNPSSPLSSSSFSHQRVTHHGVAGGRQLGGGGPTVSGMENAELLEVMHQHRALRTAVITVVDAVLQRACSLIADMSLQQHEEDAAVAEVALTQGLRELIQNGCVALAQYVLVPPEPRSRSFKFSRYPLSSFLSMPFAGSGLVVTNNNNPTSSSIGGGGSYSSPSSSASLSSSSSAGAGGGDSTHATAALTASIPNIEMLCGKNYDTDRSTTIVFMQRLLVLSRRLGVAGSVLQEFARRNVSATLLSILDVFNSKRSQRLINSASSSAAAAAAALASSAASSSSSPSSPFSDINNTKDNNSNNKKVNNNNSFSLTSASVRGIEAGKDEEKAVLEIVADSLLTTIHNFSNEVLSLSGSKRPIHQRR